MGTFIEREKSNLCDTGSAPEFYITDIGKAEFPSPHDVRFYLCVKRGSLLLVQFTCIIPVTDIAIMAREAMQIAAEHHNTMRLGAKITAH